jgi:hypothetical protein
MTLAMMAGFQNLCQVEEITIPEDGNDDNNIALLGKFLIQVSLLRFFCMTIYISQFSYFSMIMSGQTRISTADMM